MRELRAEDLLGREVVDCYGRKAGHLEEARVSKEEGRYYVNEWLIGSTAFFERLSGSIFAVLGLRRALHGYVARWDQLDLSDPTHPRLTCRYEDLGTLAEEQQRSSVQED